MFQWFTSENTQLSALKELVPPASKLLRWGWGNGYVKIPKGHWLYGLHYSEINRLIRDTPIHGGLTYSRHVRGEWIVGFDTLHTNSSVTMGTKEDVVNETIRLATMLFNLKDPIAEMPFLDIPSRCSACEGNSCIRGCSKYLNSLLIEHGIIVTFSTE